MAIVHPNAEISPTKLEIVRDWLASQAWCDADSDALEGYRRFTYRFDDPAGEVGIESVLVRAGEQVFQLPLTYRAEPVDSGPAVLLTTMEHSVLGPRWIYFGPSDPVLVTAFATAIMTGGQSVGLTFQHDGQTMTAETSVRARGTGSGDAPQDLRIDTIEEANGVTTVTTDAGTLTVPHRLEATEAATAPALLGSWKDLTDEVVLARWQSSSVA